VAAVECPESALKSGAFTAIFAGLILEFATSASQHRARIEQQRNHHYKIMHIANAKKLGGLLLLLHSSERYYLK
jgi:hypothetical protein